jgi:hypothetical protein
MCPPSRLQWAMPKPGDAVAAKLSLSRHLPSCKVSRQLLVELEGYLRERRADGLFAMSVTEASGVATWRSVRDCPELFPDGTKTIALTWDAAKGQDLSIAVRFDVRKQHSLASIEFDDSARETARAVLAEMERLIAPYQTSHYLCHSSILWGLVPLLWAWALATQWRHLKLVLGDVALLGMSAALYGMAYLQPFTMFETALNRKKERWAEPVKTGLLVFALAVIAFGAVRPLVE